MGTRHIRVSLDEKLSRFVTVDAPTHAAHLGPCHIWQGALVGGYGVIGRGHRDGGNTPAHRAAYERKFGVIPPDLFACHRCDVRACINPDHIFLGTPADNNADAASKGRTARGERHHNVQLTAEDVIRIRALWADGGLTQDQIAERFGTNKANVSQIVRGKKWRHLLPSDWTPPARAKWSRASV